MLRKLSLTVLSILLLAVSACDSNTIVGSTPNPNLSDPDIDVAQNVGPAQQLITQHVLNKSNAIRDDILNQLELLFGVGDTTRSDFLVVYAQDDTSFIDQTETVDISESIACDAGGSRDIIGNMTITLNEDLESGSITGEFTIVYDNCQEIALMEASDGNCTVTPTLNGEIASTISTSYTTLVNNLEIEREVRDTTSISSSSNSPIAVTVDNNNSNQEYNFSYSLSSLTTATGLDGTLTYFNEIYAISEVANFVNQSASALVCP